MRIYDLKTCQMRKAFGIDLVPYFSWKIQSERNNVLQTRYQIRVLSGEDMIWDSGIIDSREQSFVEYDGPKLLSCTEYRWTVEVWDNQNNSASEESFFETAYQSYEEWTAELVGSTIERVPVTEYKYGNTAPAVLFEKKFTLADKPIRRARAYATSYGVYRLNVNDIRPDDREFAPEFTVYPDLLYYQTYDVTKLLRSGENHWSMYVGDGWYFSLQAGPVKGQLLKRPAVLLQMEVEYADGTKERIGTDGTETCRLDRITYSDIFQGEKQDYTLGKQESHPVEVLEMDKSILRAQPMPPVRPMKVLEPADIFVSPKGETIIDFGQLLAGRARFMIEEPAGTEITLDYFETLDVDGNYINTMFAPQKDIIVCDGSIIDYEAYFTFHGFRYIRVSGMENVKRESIRGVLLTTEKENYSTFESSDARLNRLYQNVRWSQYNNMMSIPTDCPGREKAGWTGDLLIYVKTALLNENMTPFLNSWLRNVEKNQQDDGVVTITTPYTKLYDSMLHQQIKDFGDEKITGVAGWSDAIVWVPYMMYQVTGNIRVLKDYYGPMKKWADWIVRTAKEKRGNLNLPEEIDQYLWDTGFHFGEWLIPSRPVDGKNNFIITRESSYYIAPYFGYRTMTMMAEIAEVLGLDDKDYFCDMADKMKHAIQQGLFYGKKLPENLMGAYIIPFMFGLVPEDLKEEYKEKIVSLIEKNGNCLDTGFLATPFILDVLSELGRPDLAHALLWQDKKPSWLYEVDHGATAIWEAWDANEAQKDGRYISFQHYAFGCVDDWICRKIAGIDSDTPGFRHLIIAPEVDPKLTYCRRTFESEAGAVRVAWDEEKMEVTIPCNATATVCWKGKQSEIGSGTYQFS